MLTLILEKGDPLRKEAEALGIHVMTLLPELSLPRRAVDEALKKNAALRKKVERWVRRLETLKPDIGVVYYGHWLPPALYTMPPHGFLNYHPAPLPDLRGMEPDTMAVLQGRRAICGTVHKVTHDYDDGPIYARTRVMRLTRYTTPLEIFERLSDYGINAIVRVLTAIARDKALPHSQGTHHALDATRKRAREESTIQWNRDSNEMIERRRRAFIGQDIGIRLKAKVCGRVYAVDDVETHKGPFPGRAGQVIGQYTGKGAFAKGPIIRTREGAAVLRLGKRMVAGAKKEPPARWILPSGRRPKQTRRDIVRRSIER